MRRISLIRWLLALQGWHRTMMIMFMAQLFSAMGFSIIFPFLSLYVDDLGSVLGWNLELLSGMVFSSQALTMMLAAPVWGVLADRYGRKVMVERAMFGGAILLALMAFVNSAEELVLLRAVQGLVTGTVTAANALVSAEAPRERAGFAMGLLQMSLWSGLALGPLVGGVLADAYGFRTPFLVTAILLLFSGILVLFGVNEHFERPIVTEENRSLSHRWRRLLSIQGVSQTYIIRFLTGLGSNIYVPMAPLFVATLLPSTTGVSSYTGLVVSISSFTGTISAVYLGRLGDQIGHRYVLIVSAAAMGVFFLFQTLVADVGQLLFLQALVGLASGGVVASPTALLAHYTPFGEEGTVYGLDSSVMAAARAIAPLIGSLVAATIALRSVFTVTGVLYLFVMVLTYKLLPQVNPKQEVR